MKKILFCLTFLLLSAGVSLAQDEGTRYLESVAKAYEGLKDYTCDVRVHFDVEALKSPDMEAKVYYKAPDKLKVESKKIFFFPREGGFFNPGMFRPQNFDIIILERLTYNGGKAVKLKLIPQKAGKITHEITLTIDTERNLIREMNISQFGGRVIKAAIEYGKFDTFQLPTRIGLDLDIPPQEPNESKEFDQFAQRGRRMTGKVDITYSKYKVNSGLSDEMFTEKESQKRR